ncbi:unnamed protein product [Brassica oleracea]|uniref:Uncharacterized protein n=1 Tax=Brassica oleracea var. oleracea TaxID=109376 RepID=A0A0D3C0Z7_BRAOL
MTTVKPSTLTYLIQHLLRHAKPKSPVCLFCRLISNPNQQRGFRSLFFFSPTSSSLPLQCPYISLSSHSYLNTCLLLANQNKIKTTCPYPLIAQKTMKTKRMGWTVHWFLREKFEEALKR